MNEAATTSEAGNGYGQFSTGVPAQAGSPEAEQVQPGAARKLQPVQLAAIGGVLTLAVAGGLAWVLLGQEGEPPAVTTSAAAPPSSSATVSPSNAGSGQGAAVATRNPFGGGAGAGSAVPDTNASTASGGGSTVTSTVTQRVTATVSVPVVSTVTATATTTQTVTPTSVYVFLAGYDSGTDTADLVVNDAAGESVVVGNATTASPGVTVVTEASTTCIAVRLTSATGATPEQVCVGEAAQLA
jgi:hypothetical protein